MAVIALLTLGPSHILQPKVWAGFFVYLHGKGKTGSFINAFIHFPLGALIVAFHNVWTGVPLLLTLLGYAWVLKSAVTFWRLPLESGQWPAFLLRNPMGL